MSDNERLRPLERLMLDYIAIKAYPFDGRVEFPVWCDLIDVTNYSEVFFFGPKKWFESQMVMAFIQLESLEQAGYLQWRGSSRALGRRGYHGGQWSLTEKGIAYANARLAERMK